MEPWNPGTLEPRNPGTMEPWNYGILELWNPGTLAMKPGGTMETWNYETWNHETIKSWNYGVTEPWTLELWNYGFWNPGTLEPRNPWTLYPWIPEIMEPLVHLEFMYLYHLLNKKRYIPRKAGKPETPVAQGGSRKQGKGGMQNWPVREERGGAEGPFNHAEV